jgi:flagella basal body P-ring formation protein FlgA
MRDPAHPGGPGVLVAEESVRDQRWFEGAIMQLHPVIRAGDRLLVEQSTAKADIRIEGIALSPATPGATLRVRLAISGTVVQTVAVGQGRATMAPEIGRWQ